MDGFFPKHRIGRPIPPTLPHRIIADVMHEVNPGKIVAEVMGSVREHLDEGLGFSGLAPHTSEAPEEFSLEAEGIRKVSLLNVRGDIEVTGTQEGAINVRAEKRSWGHSPEQAEERVHGIKVSQVRQGATLNIRVEGGPWVKKRHARVDFTLTIPSATELEVSTTQGDVEVTGVCSEVNLKTASGDVSLSKGSGAAVISSLQGDIEIAGFAGGRLSVEATSGDIEVRGTEGELVVKTMSGDVSMQEVRGKIQLNSMNGDLDLETVSGEISVNTLSGDLAIHGGEGILEAKGTNGDIEVDSFTADRLSLSTTSGDISADVRIKETGSADLRTTHGDIDLSIPSDTKANVEAETQSGDVSCDLALVEREESGRRISGTLNGGGAKIVVQSGHGDVQVRGK